MPRGLPFGSPPYPCFPQASAARFCHPASLRPYFIFTRNPPCSTDTPILLSLALCAPHPRYSPSYLIVLRPRYSLPPSWPTPCPVSPPRCSPPAPISPPSLFSHPRSCHRVSIALSPPVPPQLCTLDASLSIGTRLIGLACKEGWLRSRPGLHPQPISRLKSGFTCEMTCQMLGWEGGRHTPFNNQVLST